MKNQPRNARYLVAGLIAVITFLVYLPALQNEFVNWDDDDYVYDNPFIQEINLRFLKWVFFSFHAANWHPLTWISHALDYAIWGLNPWGHHLTSILLHALNTFLVVVLTARLVEAATPAAVHDSPFTVHPSRATLHNSPFTFHFSPFSLIAAATTGLLFGIHPVHVESVAWIAERKDLLCAFFFLLSIIAYVSYARTAERGMQSVKDQTMLHAQFDRHHAPCTMRSALCAMFSSLCALRYAFCFFILALMSKPMAVTLPVVLLIIDWHTFGRIHSIRTFGERLLEKLPFFLLSLLSSVITILAQHSGKAIVPLEVATLPVRFILGAKALVMYLVHVLVPVDLLPFYPYPKDVSLVSFKYGLMVLIVIGVSAVCIAVARKQKLWLAAWLFYVITVLPVLGIIRVGHQSMADRYTYLPTVVCFIIAGLGISILIEKILALVQWRVVLGAMVIGMSFLILLASYATIGQIALWKNSIVLWSYLIEREPHKIPLAYYNRGLAYGKKNQLDLSIDDFTAAIAISPAFGMAHNNRGVAYLLQEKPESALENFSTALELDNNNAEAFINRAYVYLKMGRKALAIPDLQRGCDLGNRIGCDLLQKVARN